MASIEDSVLGKLEFIYLDSAWIGTVDTPGFAAFTYDGDRSRCELKVEAETEEEVPTTAALDVARRVVANHKQLVGTITRALWEDFNGRGPKSDMWWHGHLEKVDRGGTRLPPITGPDVLLKWMSPQGILVYQARGKSRKPALVELFFRAAFEKEHSVGILTDGVNILGAGYSLDRVPYKKGKSRKS